MAGTSKPAAVLGRAGGGEGPGRMASSRRMGGPGDMALRMGGGGDGALLPAAAAAAAAGPPESVTLRGEASRASGWKAATCTQTSRGECTSKLC